MPSSEPAGRPAVLEELHVRDLALIEEAWLELGPGMTALTGETGAGKTVLVGALKLLIGERADSSSVRAGAGESLVEGRFVNGGAEITARRRVSADGRSRCYLDGEMATVGALADALGPLVDLHGQHDHQLLLHPSSHAGLFDAFVGEPARAALDAYRAAASEETRLREERDRLAASLLSRDREMERLRAVVDRVDAVRPEKDEDERIDALLPRLRHAERLMVAASAAHAALADDGGAGDTASQALAALLRVGGVDAELDAIAAELDEATCSLTDLAQRLRRVGESLDFDPGALDAMESRAAAVAELKRTYGPTLDDVLRVREEARASLDALDEGDSALERADAALTDAGAALTDAGAALSAVRDAAVEAFESAVRTASVDLAMPTARFEVSRTPIPREAWTADGPERVEFLYAPASGEPARPLARIASGGEVSRVMLALKGVLGAADEVPVLVFDEIDAGIGGATAMAVGERLRALARDHQVLVVTHLAQVAAFADHHIVVTKHEESGRAVTTVSACEGDSRISELARMLSGSASPTSLAHARELFARAGH